MVLEHLQQRFGIDGGAVSVRRTRPDDFIVRFVDRADLERVLASCPIDGEPFVLRWRHWSCLIMGSAGTFRF